MNNAAKNSRFLQVTDAETRAAVLSNIAAHYGIKSDEALAEVTDPEAEHLLDYLTGSIRSAVSVLMQRHGLRA